MKTSVFALRRVALGCLLASCGMLQSATNAQSSSNQSGQIQSGRSPSEHVRPTSTAEDSKVHSGIGGPTTTRSEAEDDYRIGAGDVLHISVWKEPDASEPGIVVRPDGKITLPLLKDVQVAGLTPREAEKLITQGLSNFITDANVTVIVTGINSKKIYVIGAVKREGPLAYTYRMTIMQAITEAGGLTDYAKRKKIYVLRAENGKETKIPFDYDAVLKGKDLERVWMLPGDTLVVPH